MNRPVGLLLCNIAIMKQSSLKECTKCSSKENVVPIKYGYPGLEMQED